MTIVEKLRQNAENHPEKAAIYFEQTKISHKDSYEIANALAKLLLEVGINKGDRVGLLLHKTPEAILSFYGVATAGGVVVPIDYNQPSGDIQYILDITSPAALIVDSKLQPLLSQLALPCPEDCILVVGKKAKDDFHEWESVLAGKTSELPDMKIEASDVVYLNFTSGTTGTPKGAVTSHSHIYWNTMSAIESLGLTPDDVHLCMFPVFVHPHELFARALFLGGTSVLVDSIYPKSIAKAMSEHRVTSMMAISPIYKTLLPYYKSPSFDFSSLRVPESGGMHTSPALVEQFKERFKVPIYPVWGSTEATGIALATPLTEKYKPGSMGKPCPYYEVKIIREDGREAVVGEVGEMAIKGPAVCTEYYNDPAESEKCVMGGWFFTGDLIRKDEEGYFYFVDRKARMMKVAGMKVFPLEIEEVLSHHPKIAEVAVIKVMDGLHGEVPKAFIVSKNGVTISKSEIRKYCETMMSKYKLPRIIEFQEKLPRTTGGKVLYRELK
jgi:long-chain acyl-CoA synthetase